ncbi:MAG: hypothetical protein AB7N80_10805, partial [Bdellovibrionales bacterium]
RPVWLLTVRLLAAVGALFWPDPALIALMLVGTWLVAWRWRGTLNGGSDVMTFHILAAWLVATIWPELQHGCVFYIAVQMALSYVVAGLVKIRNPDWRSGRALAVFLQRVGRTVSPPVCLILSWSLIAFELLFPLSVIAPVPVVALAIAFHLANTYILNLNRFFFVWLAGYPSVFLVSQQILRS